MAVEHLAVSRGEWISILRQALVNRGGLPVLRLMGNANNPKRLLNGRGNQICGKGSSRKVVAEDAIRFQESNPIFFIRALNLGSERMRSHRLSARRNIT